MLGQASASPARNQVSEYPLILEIGGFFCLLDKEPSHLLFCDINAPTPILLPTKGNQCHNKHLIFPLFHLNQTET